MSYPLRIIGDMCETLSGLRAGLKGWAAAFDPTAVLPSDAARILEDATVIENIAAAILGLVAGRAAAGGGWRREGDASAAHHLARKTGTSVRRAGELLDTSARLEDLPDTAAAGCRGELSPEQASAIASAAAADPGAERRLLERSRTASLAELRDECARTRASATPDAEQRRRHIHAERRLRSYPDLEGGWNLSGRNSPEMGAEVMAELDAIADELFRAARAEGRSEPREAHLADWAHTHITLLGLMDRLCEHHHDLKSLEHWALAAGSGKRAFVPPDDPRHPRWRSPTPTMATRPNTPGTTSPTTPRATGPTTTRATGPPEAA